mmetsp:Transcript_13802/g.19141  ORF Transcript_13802/g.19141 Transcript_13802/m.19141 type:complete len:80 (+) Transcript_13802:230-469(+)
MCPKKDMRMQKVIFHHRFQTDKLHISQLKPEQQNIQNSFQACATYGWLLKNASLTELSLHDRSLDSRPGSSLFTLSVDK